MLGLAFSGGKDSLACWYLYKDKTPIVFWVNTGKAYPETIEIIERIRSQAAKFVEIKTNQDEQIAKYGIPSDIVPVDNTHEWMELTGQKPVKVQSYLDCCWINKSKPLMDAVKQHGITELIRGQRLDETHKSTARHGSVVDGVTYLQPIEQWSEAQVFSFLATQGEVPDHFKIKHSSLDCYDCTAYLTESADRVLWTKENHPKLYKEYKINIDKLKSVLMPSFEILRNDNE